jgi:hypothetical protein
MSNVRIIAVTLATILIVLLVLFANGSAGRFLCRHFKGGWLEKQGYIMCYRAP